MSAQVPDTWSEWEHRALRAIYEAVNNQPNYRYPVRRAAILEHLGVPPDQEAPIEWLRAIDNLGEAGYIEFAKNSDGTFYRAAVMRVTERGLRAIGAWPSDADPLQVLVQVLVAQASAAKEQEPEKASRLLAAAEVVGKVALDVGTSFAAAFAARAAGLA